MPPPPHSLQRDRCLPCSHRAYFRVTWHLIGADDGCGDGSSDGSDGNNGSDGRDGSDDDKGTGVSSFLLPMPTPTAVCVLPAVQLLVPVLVQLLVLLLVRLLLLLLVLLLVSL
jgi:hypothetical protein